MIKPLGDRALIKAVVKKNAIEEAGFVLAPQAQTKDAPTEFEVVALGTSDKVIAIGLEIGDIVIANKYGGVEVKNEGEDYKIILSDDILGVVTETDDA